MGSGRLSPKVLLELTEEVKDISGDFAEVGVFRGVTFKQLVPIATEQSKIAHAFDSFRGMAAPGELDLPGYPEHKFDIGGPRVFRQILEHEGITASQYAIWAGYVPDCLEMSDVEEISFAYVDLDHYMPTRDAIDWITPKLAQGAVIGFDDYFESRTLGPSIIINAFRGAFKLDVLYDKNNQIFFRWS